MGDDLNWLLEEEVLKSEISLLDEFEIRRQKNIHLRQCHHFRSPKESSFLYYLHLCVFDFFSFDYYFHSHRP